MILQGGAQDAVGYVPDVFLESREGAIPTAGGEGLPGKPDVGIFISLEYASD